MFFVHQRIIFQGEKVKIFIFAYGQAGSGTPPYGQPDRKIPVFFTASLGGTTDFSNFDKIEKERKLIFRTNYQIKPFVQDGSGASYKWTRISKSA